MTASGSSQPPSLQDPGTLVSRVMLQLKALQETMASATEERLSREQQYGALDPESADGAALAWTDAMTRQMAEAFVVLADAVLQTIIRTSPDPDGP